MNDDEDTADSHYEVTRIMDVPLVVVHALPDGIRLDAADAILSVNEVKSLIEQLHLALDQIPRLRYVEEEGPFGLKVTKIVEDEK